MGQKRKREGVTLSQPVLESLLLATDMALTDVHNVVGLSPQELDILNTSPLDEAARKRARRRLPDAALWARQELARRGQAAEARKAARTLQEVATASQEAAEATPAGGGA